MATGTVSDFLPFFNKRTEETNRTDGDLNYDAKLVVGLVAKYNCHLIKMRKAYLDYDLKKNPENKEKGILTVGGIHPPNAENKLIAKEMMKVLVPDLKWMYKIKSKIVIVI
jgi:hypothetical protein